MRVDFYLLDETQAAAPLSLYCRLIEKVFRAGQTLFIHTGQETLAKQLDDQLWTYHDIGFIPHHLQGSSVSSPIEISFKPWQTIGALPLQQVLLNLTTDVLPIDKQSENQPTCSRILEIVLPTQTQVARDKYRHHQACRAELYTHNLGEAAPIDLSN